MVFWIILLPNNDLSNKVPFSFGIDNDGNYGYKKAGADTVIPFKQEKYGFVFISGTTASVSDKKIYTVDASSLGFKKIYGVGISELSTSYDSTLSKYNLNLVLRWYHASDKRMKLSFDGTKVIWQGSPYWDYGYSLTWTLKILVVGE